MEKNQYDLMVNILNKLNEAGVLSEITIVGSWCQWFYQNHLFDTSSSFSVFRTRDIDFMINDQPNLRIDANIPELLKELGFIEGRDSDGYYRLEHPDLIVEFLLPNNRKGTTHLSELNIVASSSRMLKIFQDDIITIDMENNPKELKQVFCSLIPSWQKRILSVLKKAEEREIIHFLSGN